MSNSRVVSHYPDIKQITDERWVPPLPDASKPVDPSSPKCLGCSRYHGSPGVELNCLRSHLLQAREAAVLSDEVRNAGLALLALRKSVAETQALPYSRGGLVEFHLFNGKRRA
jgi:hypothetical protein